MASAFPQLTVANMLVIAGLACIAITIFGRARDTNASSGNFRAVSGLTGVLLLFCVYGTHLPRAAHSNGAQTGPTAEKRTAQAEQDIAAWQMQPLAPSAQTAAQNSPLSAQEQPTMPSAVQQPTKGFNVNAARRSGYSDDEILHYLAQTRNFDAAGALRAGYSKSEIIDYLAGVKSAQPAPQAPAEGLFSGKWKNADPKAASVLFLKVEEQGGALTVRAWGMCASQYCDWGTGHGTVRDGAADVTWEQGPVLRRMRLLPAAGALRVVLDSTYRDRRPPQHSEAHFAKSL